MPSLLAASTNASKAAASVRASWTSSSRKDACGSGTGAAAAVRGRGDGGGRSKGVCGGDRGALRMPIADNRARIESTATVDSRTISLVRNALLS